MTRFLIGLLACLLASSATAHADTKAPLNVKLSVPKQLQLGKKGYRGKITAELTNTSDKPITVHHLEASSLVFETDGGKLDVICHSCACMAWSEGTAQARPPFSAVLQKGEKRTIKLDDWGCGGGSWPGPPPGTYRVSYRVFLRPPIHKETSRGCCDQLRRVEFWKGAVSSPSSKLGIVMTKR